MKLKERGVEVVKGDFGDKASLVDALRGSEAVFAVCVVHLAPWSRCEITPRADDPAYAA